MFCYSLLRALEAAKKRISDVEEGKRTEAQKRHMDFFRRRGSITLMLAAISGSIELFLGKPVSDRTALRFVDNCSPKDAADHWQPIVDSALSFSSQLIDATDLGLKNTDTVEAATEKFRGMIEATVEANKDRYAAFSQTVELAP